MTLLSKLQLLVSLKLWVSQALPESQTQLKTSQALPQQLDPQRHPWRCLRDKQQSQSIKQYSFSLWYLALLGLFFGCLLMTGLLNYSGQQPINILYLLFIFGPLQWFSIALSLTFTIQNQTQRPWLSRLPRFKLLSNLPSRLVNWSFCYFIQFVSLAFCFGALMTFMLLLVVEDLAFAWSSTLQIDPQVMANLLQSFSWPWQAWLPSAGVSAELVQQTQFYRMGSNPLIQGDVYGQWWSYLALYIIFYGCLPRLIACLLAGLVLNRRIQSVLREDSDLIDILNGYREQVVSTDAQQQDQHLNVNNDNQSIQHSRLNLAQRYCLWGLAEEDFKRLQVNYADLQQNQHWPEQQPLDLIVPGWEPPLAALADRLAVHKQQQINLYLLPLEEGLNPVELHSWQLFLSRQGFARCQLYVLEFES